jgi:hypothetical protein
MWKLGLIGISLAVLVGSFVLTLWLTDVGVPEGSELERFAASRILNRSDLIEAAVDAGLRPSSQMDGRIESMNRINSSEVAITGWLADHRGDETPIKLLIFVAGKKVAAAQTHGERADVTVGMHLGFGAEKNVLMEATFNCAPHEQPVLVGLGVDKQYFYLPSSPCP